jgi:hypothetical protein
VLEFRVREFKVQSAGVQSFFSVASVASVADKKIPKILKILFIPDLLKSAQSA